MKKQESIILYRSSDGDVTLDVQLKGEIIWLSLKQISELFARDKSVISRHLRNIFATGELHRQSVVAKNATTAADGKSYLVEYFNLDAIISCCGRCAAHDIIVSGPANSEQDERSAFDFALTNVLASFSRLTAALRSG
jgi:hypothetical protein